MLKPHHGLDATQRYNGDERSSRKPGVQSARAKQVAANKDEWRRRALKNRACSAWILDTQIFESRVTYVNSHLLIA